jgi:hypothetical protein
MGMFIYRLGTVVDRLGTFVHRLAASIGLEQKNIEGQSMCKEQ